ncbi:flagellar protein FlaG [Duganella sp. LX20W]|uniref:Flagellar protein FlaG n=1 Tax=Rugamonas brunnea TaxID=2758569 RepID=A0A7W2EWA5_9BURK|nr:flagellar protein FlaG [Rugamonas brunnea]MBA5639740.1 flagellar protein FlaG [Rugamonas brunnea]
MTIDSLSTASAARPIERHPAGYDAAPAPAGTARAPATAVETAAAVKGAGAVPTLDQVSQAVSQLNQSPQARAQGLEFSIDKDSKRTVVKVIDQTTKEVLRQIPSPEALEIAKSLGNTNHSSGLLIKQTA